MTLRTRAAVIVSMVVAATACAAEAFADPIVVERSWPDEWPMDPAPIETETWPVLPPTHPPVEPATSAAARVVAMIQRVEATQVDHAYQHRTRVDERRHRYRWDCSGMVSWIIHRASPRAGRAIGRDRTSARGIYTLIERAPTARARRGWQRIDHIDDVRPGDLFAWRTPPGSPSRMTGHTGFVVERPRPVPGLRDAYAVRVADSVGAPHQEDTRPENTPGGLGLGVFVFLTDGHGHATHYGWHGTYTRAYMRTPVLFGRIH